MGQSPGPGRTHRLLVEKLSICAIFLCYSVLKSEKYVVLDNNGRKWITVDENLSLHIFVKGFETQKCCHILAFVCLSHEFYELRELH